MKEARKTIIVAALAAALLNLEARLPIERAGAFLQCVKMSAIAART